MHLMLSRGGAALLVVSVGLCAAGASSASAQGNQGKKKSRREHDALAEAGRSAKSIEPGDLAKPGHKVQVEERLGVPTFLWAGQPGAAMPWDGRGKQAPESAARRHLGVYAKLWDLTPGDVATARVADVHDTGTGPVIAKFRQEVDGIEVFRDELAVVMDRQLRAIALSGYIPGSDLPGSRSFPMGAADAVARALTDFAEAEVPPGAVTADEASLAAARVEDRGGYEAYGLAGAGEESAPLRLTQPVRAKRVLFHLPDALEAAYYIEVAGQTPGEEGPDSAYLAYVVSAVDGRVLFRHDLTTSDSFTYRVWAETGGLKLPDDSPNGIEGTPHPTGVPDGFQPPFVAPNLVTLQNGPISTNDPWLPAGATETRGNNVDAYADLVAPDGFQAAGDFRASTTSPGVFDRTYDVTLSPGASTSQRMASITQLFYDNNFLHDWFYDAGFDEAAGNAQSDNFGRGGIGGDSIRAEAQDFSGINNANMSTPADGGRPRMQMFAFTGPSTAPPRITANSPAALAGTYPAGTAAGFGAQGFDLTADVVWVDDGVAGPGGSIRDGCETPWANAAAVAGKIAFIDRGGPCVSGFVTKFQNAVAAGAVGVIIANVATSANPGIAPGMGGVSAAGPTVAVLSLNLASGNLFRAQFGLATVNATLFRQLVINRDGTIDNQIVAHEWTHYLSNRLIGNSSGLSNAQGRGMGEGWSDFVALLMTVRPEDALVAGNASFEGVYALAGYATGGIVPTENHYFGIRRLPYSTDMARDPLTFKHISNGVPLPGGVPILFGTDGSNNAEVHNTGEIWATMLWEGYAALLRDTLGPSPRLTFDEARDRMRAYLVASLKLTPNAPTILEARDALLAAAHATDPVDFARFCQAFARRGAGTRAVGPDRFSTTNVGVTESFICGNDLGFVSASLDESLASCDQDGVLDDVEIGRLTVTVKNTGLGPLGNSTATISSTNPHVSLANGGVISLPASEPFQSVSGSVDVALSGAASIEVADFAISIDDPHFAVDDPVMSTFSVRVNSDDVASASATDDVESAVPVWTIAGDPTLSGASPWRRLEAGPLDHRWFAPNAGAPSDQYLVSPALHVGPGAFSFTFRHRYSFEQPVFDGGVIEISNDGGATWTDIGAATSPGYNGTLVATGSNPLRGRMAFVNASAGYPAFITATVNLGTTYAGQDVLVRFRAGADDNTVAVGWEIDDIAFSGITNTPFHAVIAHAARCNCPSIALTPASLPAGGKDVPYPPTTLTPTAGAGPFTFDVAGLPAGMTPTSTITGNDVTIGGTPTVDFTGSVTLSGADRFACSLSQSFALTIGPPAVSIGDVSVTEGQTGFTNAVFTVSLSHPAAVPVSVFYATSDGTAKHGNDYLPQQGAGHVVTIPAFASSATITVRVKGDFQTEGDETFFVSLRNPVNATLGDARGVGTIVNDDPAP
jgi:hypothetical protein